jgi:hypothetical protein
MTKQIVPVALELTPQQAMAFAWRGFDEPVVQQVGTAAFHAYTVKTTDHGFEWAEFLAMRPEVAVEQLARQIVRA